MTIYENLLEQATCNNMTVLENCKLFSGTNIKGLYCDSYVALNDDLSTNTERACVLAEELGHYHTSSGDILDQHDTSSRKQERQARIWAYNKMIGLTGIIHAYRKHCRNKHEMAELLGVTEEFLTEALEYYRQRYGIYTILDNYTIYFEPYLGVVENI